MWVKEPGLRIGPSRPLDDGKVQAPGAVVLPSGQVRLFYTAVGSAKPFDDCQGYILSALSSDGLNFAPEEGIRLAPRPDLPHAALRLLSPSVRLLPDGRWRMFVEARGRATGALPHKDPPPEQAAGTPTLICSAISDDGLNFEWEEGIRVSQPTGIRAPRFVAMPTDSSSAAGKLIFVTQEGHVGSATTGDGLNFEVDAGLRLRSALCAHESGFSAADVLPPRSDADAATTKTWTMLFSSWIHQPDGAQPDSEWDSPVPLHPAGDPEAVEHGTSSNFAAVSIAGDLNGYRSRIWEAHSVDGGANFRSAPSAKFSTGTVAIEGSGYSPARAADGYGPDRDTEAGVDAIHAEDMCLIRRPPSDGGGGGVRMFYACCDRAGVWGIASAVLLEDGGAKL